MPRGSVPEFPLALSFRENAQAPEHVRVLLEFQLFSAAPRTVAVTIGDTHVEFKLEASRWSPCTIGPFGLAPGDTRVSFDTDEPPNREPQGPGRALSFALQTGPILQAR